MTKLTDIYCPNCGAPASFNIMTQQYQCGYCGGAVTIAHAQELKQGFRKMRSEHLQNSVRQYRLSKASCTGCGAELVLEEGEALSNCAFCGRSLVRQDYLNAKNMPESVIPFRITEDEARARLAEWCRKNKSKQEAKHLEALLPKLKGFYLPYELVCGPVHMLVRRMSGSRPYTCEGFLHDAFVNRSSQLDNLLLDGMEPFDVSAMTAFDFAYVAGHRVKTPDMADKNLEARVRSEAAETYLPAVRRVLQSKAVNVNADVSSAMRYPVLLPVYFINEGNVCAAVNGQTGKVSVRAEKDSHYIFLPWWLKAILGTVAATLTVLGAMVLFGMDFASAAMICGMLGVTLLIILLCLFSDTVRNKFAVVSGRKIFTSGDRTFRREGGVLVLDEAILERKVYTPVFLEQLDGVMRPVVYRFTPLLRMVEALATTLGALFFPVILALLINGFDFDLLDLRGSAVWFCIAVPVVPVFLMKGIAELYDNPWVYLIDAYGRKKRYKKRAKIDMPSKRNIVKSVLILLFKPPVCLAVWFGIFSMIAMVYLTAFGF